MEDLIDVPKGNQLKKGWDEAAGGRVVYVQTDNGGKALFLPNHLNADFEDEFYHGIVVGDYHG